MNEMTKEVIIMVDRAERIRGAIQEKGLSYSELERITGVSKSALQRYASGETKKIPVDVIEKIASATGVSARYLMGWDESETSKEELTAALAENKRLKEELAAAQADNALLKKRLEDTQGWQPAKDLGTNMNQDAYAELADDSTPMSELDAIRRVYEMCGFDMALIRIVTTVNTYEVNKQHRCRVSGEYERAPVWSSTDWNYIRFNVADLQWELVDGELHAYYT